jgi:hypothetical protein
METPLKKFLLDYLDDIEQRRWEYEATVKAAEERRENDKPVNTRNLDEAKRKIAFYDYLRNLSNDDTSPDERWTNRYQDILISFINETDNPVSAIKTSKLTEADDVFENPPSTVDKDVWRSLQDDQQEN